MWLAGPGTASLSVEEREGTRGTTKVSCFGCLHHHSKASREQRATNTAGGSGCSQPSSEQDHTQDLWQISHTQTARTEHPVLFSSSESEWCTLWWRQIAQGMQANRRAGSTNTALLEIGQFPGTNAQQRCEMFAKSTARDRRKPRLSSVKVQFDPRKSLVDLQLVDKEDSKT